MIKKVSKLNIAVYKQYHWDNCVIRKSNGQNLVESLKDINIIFGRNYSGKTTLSRVIRSLETKEIPPKYEHVEFEIEFKDGNKITHENLNTSSKIVRVFNDDFIKENISFLSNDSDNIKSFAILGETNSNIQEEINNLTEQLGDNSPNTESGYYLTYKTKDSNYTYKKKELDKATDELRAELQKLAINRHIGIKYQSKLYGDQNYNQAKLKNEITNISINPVQALEDQEIQDFKNQLSEEVLAPIEKIKDFDWSIDDYVDTTKTILDRSILSDTRIDELVNDSVLNAWVKAGIDLHKERKSNKCSFCNSTITEKRWDQLDNHFNKEVELLESEINNAINDIEIQLLNIRDFKITGLKEFYLKFHPRVELYLEKLKRNILVHEKNLNSLHEQLLSKRNNPFSTIDYIETNPYDEPIEDIINNLNSIAELSNKHSDKIEETRKEIQKKLRIDYINTYLIDNDYEVKKAEIETLRSEVQEKFNQKDEIQKLIEETKAKIDHKKSLLQDETLGAEKINQFLQNHFGHSFISLDAVENEYGDNNYKFEIKRNGQKAFNLSQGECSLIAFCYFIAKLNDSSTAGQKPIILIDDPISSLDYNHIFFIFSLIDSEICTPHNYEQLIISTHNTTFLKYLARLNTISTQRLYLLIHRKGEFSEISIMPKYLKEQKSQFIYLFEQIYTCAKYQESDSNIQCFHNFGNNARKFLELYLFFKFPTQNRDNFTNERLKQFFNNEELSVSLINRITNEFSHSVLEQGETVLDVPEMKVTAQKILEGVQNADHDQYESLLGCIDHEPL